MQNYDELKVSELEQHDVPYGHALVLVKAAGLTFVDLLYVSKHSNGYAILKVFTSLSYDNNYIIIWHSMLHEPPNPPRAKQPSTTPQNA